MTVHIEDLKPEQSPEPAHPRRPRWVWVVAGIVGAIILAVAALVLGFGGGLFHPHGSRALPRFPSLADQPDPSLHGTVAYFSDDSHCVRIIAASGRASKDVLCLSQSDLAVRPEQGVKPAGPQLVWLAGDRLEVTMFLWKPATGTPVYTPDWQKVVDVRTGKVDVVAPAQVPSMPNTAGGPTVSPSGEQVAYTFDAATGRVQVTLTDPSGSRTLLSVRGPGEYTYRFGPVFWAPNWKWIAASDDGRILVITPGSPAATRVLVTHSGGGAGGGTAGPAFAVTGSDLLS